VVAPAVDRYMREDEEQDDFLPAFRPGPTLADLLAGDYSTTGDRPPSEFEQPSQFAPSDYGPPPEPDWGSEEPAGPSDWGPPPPSFYEGEAERPPSTFEAPSPFAPPRQDWGTTNVDWGAPAEQPPSEFEAPSAFAPAPSYDWGAPAEQPPSEFEAPSPFAPTPFADALAAEPEAGWSIPTPFGGPVQFPPAPPPEVTAAARTGTGWLLPDVVEQAAAFYPPEAPLEKIPVTGWTGPPVVSGALATLGLFGAPSMGAFAEGVLHPERGPALVGLHGLAAGAGSLIARNFAAVSRAHPEMSLSDRIGAAMDLSKRPWDEAMEEAAARDPTGGRAVGLARPLAEALLTPSTWGGVGGFRAAGAATTGGRAAALGMAAGAGAGEVFSDIAPPERLPDETDDEYERRVRIARANYISTGAGVGQLLGAGAVGATHLIENAPRLARGAVSAVDRALPAVREANAWLLERGLAPGLTIEPVGEPPRPVPGEPGALPELPGTRVPGEPAALPVETALPVEPRISTDAAARAEAFAEAVAARPRREIVLRPPRYPPLPAHHTFDPAVLAEYQHAGNPEALWEGTLRASAAASPTGQPTLTGPEMAQLPGMPSETLPQATVRRGAEAVMAQAVGRVESDLRAGTVERLRAAGVEVSARLEELLAQPVLAEPNRAVKAMIRQADAALASGALALNPQEVWALRLKTVPDASRSIAAFRLRVARAITARLAADLLTPEQREALKHPLAQQGVARSYDDWMTALEVGRPAKDAYRQYADFFVDRFGPENLREALSVFAVTSAQTALEDNVATVGYVMAKMRQYAREGLPAEGIAERLRADVEADKGTGTAPDLAMFAGGKYNAIQDLYASGAHEMGGAKTASFQNNTESSLSGEYDPNATNDTWVFQMGGSDKPGNVGSNDVAYRGYNALINYIARDTGLMPHEVQAAVWYAIRGFETDPAFGGLRAAVRSGQMPLAEGLRRAAEQGLGQNPQAIFGEILQSPKIQRRIDQFRAVAGDPQPYRGGQGVGLTYGGQAGRDRTARPVNPVQIQRWRDAVSAQARLFLFDGSPDLLEAIGYDPETLHFDFIPERHAVTLTGDRFAVAFPNAPPSVPRYYGALLARGLGDPGFTVFHPTGNPEAPQIGLRLTGGARGIDAVVEATRGSGLQPLVDGADVLLVARAPGSPATDAALIDRLAQIGYSADTGNIGAIHGTAEHVPAAGYAEALAGYTAPPGRPPYLLEGTVAALDFERARRAGDAARLAAGAAAGAGGAAPRYVGPPASRRYRPAARATGESPAAFTNVPGRAVRRAPPTVTERGQAHPEYALRLGGATAGAATGYETAEPRRPDESLVDYGLRVAGRTAAGGVLGGVGASLLTPGGRRGLRQLAGGIEEAGLTPGLSTRVVGEPPAGEAAAAPPFFSQLRRAIEGLRQPRGDADQIAATLRSFKGEGGQGVKPAELAWTGLDDYLAAAKAEGRQVTRDELLRFLDEHEIRVEEVELGGGRPVPEELVRAAAQASERERAANQALQAQFDRWGYTPQQTDQVLDAVGPHYARALQQFPDEINAYHQAAATEADAADALWAAQRAAQRPATVYPGHMLPGGAEGSYRELVLTLPPRPVRAPEGMTHVVFDPTTGENISFHPTAAAARDEAERLGMDYDQVDGLSGEGAPREHRFGPYVSSHWEETPGIENPVLHARFDERIIDGQRVLYVDEIQSDWHQEGRSRGYRGERTPGELLAGWTVTQQPDGSWTVRTERGVSVASGDTREAAIERAGPAADYYARQAAGAVTSQPVPRAPFEKEWPELAVKRLVRYAAEHGYDRIAFAPGEVHAGIAPATGERSFLGRWGTERLAWVKETVSSYTAVNRATGTEMNLGPTPRPNAELIIARLNENAVEGGGWALGERPATGFRVSVEPQVGGRTPAGEDLGAAAQARGLIANASEKVETLDDLRALLNRSGRRTFEPGARELREGRDVANRLWARMQAAPEGVMMPRAEGMSGFYDRTLPGTLRDLAKKFGGAVGQVEIPVRSRTETIDADAALHHALTGEGAPPERVMETVTANSIEITPQMRAQALERGFPLFLRQPTPRIGAPGLANVAGAVAGGAAGYAAGDETETPFQRAGRVLGGAVLGATGVQAARGAARGGLRGALAAISPEGSVVDRALGIDPRRAARARRDAEQAGQLGLPGVEPAAPVTPEAEAPPAPPVTRVPRGRPVPAEPGTLPPIERPGAAAEWEALGAPPEALPGAAGALPAPVPLGAAEPLLQAAAAPAAGAPVPRADLETAAAAAAAATGHPTGVRRFWDRARNVIASAGGVEGREIAQNLLDWRDRYQPQTGELLAQMPTVKTLSRPQRAALAATRDAPLAPVADPVVARALAEWRAVKDTVELRAQQVGLDHITLEQPGDGREVLRQVARIAQQEIFGDGSRARQLVAAIRARDPNAGATVEQLLGVALAEGHPGGVREGLRKAQSFLRMDLGLLSNATQSVNTAAVVGAMRTARFARMARSAEGQARAEKMGVILGGAIDAMQDAFGAGQPGARGALGTALNWATAPGFGPVERFNRTLAALAGEDYAIDVAARAFRGDRRAAEELGRLGLDADIVRAQGGQLNEAQRTTAARRIVDRTQYQVDPQDLPGWASSPNGRLVTQFKAFAYNQPGFVKNEILRPLAEGRVGPLVTWIGLGLPAGLTVIELRNAMGLDWVNQGAAAFGPHEDETMPGYLARGMLRAGGGGLVTDVVEQGMRTADLAGRSARALQIARPIVGTVLGPTAGTAVQYLDLASQANRGDPTELQRALLRDVPPVIGPALQNLLMPYSRLGQHVSSQTKETLARYNVPLTNPAFAPDPSEPHFSPAQLQLYHRTAGPLVDQSVAATVAAPSFGGASPEQQSTYVANAVARAKQRHGEGANPVWTTPQMIAALDTIPEADLRRLAAAYDAAPAARKRGVLVRDNYRLMDYATWIARTGGGTLNRPEKIAAYLGARP
jgi:hypothetical protein